LNPQGTEGWLQDKCGKLGASSIGDMMAKTKTGYGATRANLMARLITERLTGKPVETYKNAAMQWGNDTEPQARAAYGLVFGVDVVETGFLPHPVLENAGCSPDGLIGDDGLIEIKCPNTATHIETLLGSPIDKKYQLQMQFQMDVTGRQWCSFVSFDPRMPAQMQMHVRRVERDEKIIAEIRTEAAKFLAEIDKKIVELNRKYPTIDQEIAF